MKHISLVILALITFQLSAQKKIFWFDAGLKAQYGAAGFYNAAVGSSKLYDHTISTGYSFGGKLGINKNYSGLSLEVMRNSGKQEFEIKQPNTPITTGTIKWSSTDIYALFRNAQNMGYFEIGPKISLIDKVKSKSGSAAETDVAANFNKNVYAGVLGFGANVMGNEGSFSGILGVRFEYAFSDFNKEAATPKETLAPIGDPTIYADGYKKSNIAFAGLVFELNWGIGYYGKAQCGKRSKFIMF
jgi:hypothetical protein